jgi:hypothetical protein
VRSATQETRNPVGWLVLKAEQKRGAVAPPPPDR